MNPNNIKAILDMDAVDFGGAFEDWLEQEFPSLSLQARADMGRKVIEFIEIAQDNNK